MPAPVSIGPRRVRALRSLPLLLTAALLAARPAAAARPDQLHPCQPDGVKGAAFCGTLPVWEDREAKSGRKIDINVVVLPALGSPVEPDAVTSFGGGPGEAATEFAGGLSTLSEVRQHRDILLVDQRGTGHSNPLNCDFYGPGSHAKGADPRLLAGDQFPVAAVRECRPQLEKVANLKLYTTDLAMDDVDEVRAWLGYPRLDLWGGSYGTRAAQVYLRRHPTSVRAVVLDGVAPVDETLPLHHAYAGQRAMNLLLAECAADAACHAAFPHVQEELAAVMARVDRGVEVTVADTLHGGTFKVTPSRGLIAEGLRFMMYGSAARRVPLAIHRAYGGDLSQLVSLAITRVGELDHELSMGMYLSVTCAEDVPYIDAAAAARLTAGTLLGDYRIRQQVAACAAWPRATIPADAHQPVRSEAPVLLFSGERDPVTPPEFGERVASQLPNGLLVVVPHGSHGADSPCAEGIITHFLDRASVKGLDTSCMKALPATTFVTSMPVAVKVAPAVLDRAAGVYELPGFEITITRRGDHLYAHASGETDDAELTALADNRFAMEANDVEIELVAGPDGAVTGVVVKSGDQVMRGRRKP